MTHILLSTSMPPDAAVLALSMLLYFIRLLPAFAANKTQQLPQMKTENYDNNHRAR